LLIDSLLTPIVESTYLNFIYCIAVFEGTIDKFTAKAINRFL